jgi:hypothetical protein
MTHVNRLSIEKGPAVVEHSEGLEVEMIYLLAQKCLNDKMTQRDHCSDRAGTHLKLEGEAYFHKVFRTCLHISATALFTE